jgi:hypothetical protein
MTAPLAAAAVPSLVEIIGTEQGLQIPIPPAEILITIVTLRA